MKNEELKVGKEEEGRIKRQKWVQSDSRLNGGEGR